MSSTPGLSLDSNLTAQTRHCAIFSPSAWPDKKTIDIGRNGVTIAADPYGGIYQITAPTPHKPHYALMIAAPWEQFDPCLRQDPAAVRLYRKKMEHRLGQQVRGQGLRLFAPANGVDVGKNLGAVLIHHVQSSLGSHVQYEYEALDGTLFVQSALCVREDGAIVQASQVTNISGSSCINGNDSDVSSDNHNNSQTVSLPVTLDLAFAVSRASYGQLTDQGEVPMPSPTNTIHTEWASANGGQTPVYCIGNAGLAQQVTAYGVFYNSTRGTYYATEEVFGAREGLGGRAMEDQHPPSKLAALSKTLKPQVLDIDVAETVRLGCVLRAEEQEESGVDADGKAKRTASGACRRGGDDFDAERVMPTWLFAHEDGVSDPHRILQRYRDAVREQTGEDVLESVERRILWSNVNYVIGCCSAPVKSEDGRAAVAVVADHVALPLGWPRDNYWQLRLLQNVHLRGFDKFFPHDASKADEYSQTVHGILRGHLEWLFTVAQVGSGDAAAAVDDEADNHSHYWRRSYLVSGRPKDGLVYQLDTQLYPFLQLCDYHRAYAASKPNVNVDDNDNNANNKTNDGAHSHKTPSPAPSASSAFSSSSSLASSSASSTSRASTSTPSFSMSAFTDAPYTNPDTNDTTKPHTSTAPTESHTAFIHRLLSTPTFRLVLTDLLSRIDSTTNLFTTDETPADDDTSDFPFHMSSNLLAWYTLKSVADLMDEFGSPSLEEDVVLTTTTAATLSPNHIRSLCTALRGVIYAQLTCDCPDGSGEKMFAYAMGTAAATNHDHNDNNHDDTNKSTKAVNIRVRTYHDGNDMPTLFAHEWGFLRKPADQDLETSSKKVAKDADGEIKEDDPHWRRIWEKTLEWAFTPDPEYYSHCGVAVAVDDGRRKDQVTGNRSVKVAQSEKQHHNTAKRPIYNTGYAGTGTEPLHGLGSDHSPGSWTLGLYQEWRFAQLTRDPAREASAWRRICAAMQWDGTFSEAVDVWSGLCTSKTWFSWPGAMIGENLIGRVVEQMETEVV
ncbi:hypothetical protein BD289DRAFT_485271 [Coniella lustricola]|uniref:Six-hairpin glycosidase-like protein n=1 Tax=Coniella lustricola TaxID=2025994 RepID=A0A2T2ZZ86_9PEZI|nr:hypothetical protein BD289DRAFT_485271 [Coniella lustricola]